MNIEWMELLGVLLMLAGFVVGLGAVVVIDILGFLARHSSYWTETTIRAHKVTKPLIWAGTALAVFGGALLYYNEPFWGIPALHSALAVLLVLNGCFLSFVVSPYLLKREKDGKAKELLPAAWQRKVLWSFILSDLLWWSALLLFALYLTGAL